MIFLIHKDNKSLQVLDNTFHEIDIEILPSITEMLFYLAKKFPNELIIWSHQAYLEFINTSEIPNIFHHKQILASYSVSNNNFIPEDIGYVDTSVFLNIKKEVCYPTWLMSSDLGGVSAEFLLAIENKINYSKSFDYFLNSLAKLAMPKGLFCYSAPKLLKSNVKPKFESKQASNYELFKFVKQHYKWVWVFVLFFCNIIYKKRLPLLSFIKSFFHKRFRFGFKSGKIQSSKIVINKKEIDVIIPTIGRKLYLYDVLKDLSIQTWLPKHVIIVEQNPLIDSVSELNYIKLEQWPFNIKHIFTHQTGVCNARNEALKLVESEWVFLNDDDNRFQPNLLQTIFEKIGQYGINVLTTKYLQGDEKLSEEYNNTHQTGIFGSGNSVVKTSSLKNCGFNMALEFGYGEDFDFGMQLRNNGMDVVYFPDVSITHLKAPMGGFRTKVKQQWDDDAITPKPSPTIMYTFLKHYTENQILSYKLVLFFRLLKKQPFYNYFTFYNEFQKKWQASKVWANKLS